MQPNNVGTKDRSPSCYHLTLVCSEGGLREIVKTHKGEGTKFY